MKKSQASIEFIIYVSILLLIGTVVVASWWPLRNAAYNDKIEKRALDTTNLIALHIDSAQKIGDGYIGRFTIDRDFLGVEYNVTISDYFITTSWQGRSTIHSIIVRNISGNIQKGSNTIQNVGGTIIVN